jgi:putative ABC transport system permease protein
VLGPTAGAGTLAQGLLPLDHLVYLPEAVARHEIGGEINRIVLKTDYDHPANRLVGNLDGAMRSAHRDGEDYGIITQERGLALVIKLLNMAQALLVLIAAISLLVAGVGIMNIMLVTVTERTREIGIRKTVGARRSDVFQQFLIEAIVLSVTGGAIGLLVSRALCAAIARYSPVTPQITPGLVALALGICTLVGVVFGVAPAVRAAALDPIEALRHE